MFFARLVAEPVLNGPSRRRWSGVYGRTCSNRGSSSPSSVTWPSHTSPYSILGVLPSSPMNQIKEAFRKLAKEHHPDLNPNLKDSDTKMAVFVSAYDTILQSRRSATQSSSSPVQQRVTLACEEATTVEQLRHTHTVYALQILYRNHVDDDTRVDDGRSSSIESSTDEPEHNTALSNAIVYKLLVHPDDSIADIKHVIQEQYGNEWGLTTSSSTWNRPDRYGLALGWELVREVGGIDEEPNPMSLEILGNHWFLDTYSIEHGDWIYAIVSRSSSS